MKSGSLIGLIIVVIAIAAAVLVLNGDENERDEEEAADATIEESSSGQFIQLAPDDDTIPAPPGGANEAEQSEPAAAESAAVSNTDSTVTAEVAGGGATISMTDTGFVPANVTIAVGETVTFVNDAQASKWPASDVHPTHRSYPGSDIAKCSGTELDAIFDACRGLATGEEYSFTFTEVGSWKYHDHLRASHGGTITVE